MRCCTRASSSPTLRCHAAGKHSSAGRNSAEQLLCVGLRLIPFLHRGSGGTLGGVGLGVKLRCALVACACCALVLLTRVSTLLCMSSGLDARVHGFTVCDDKQYFLKCGVLLFACMCFCSMLTLVCCRTSATLTARFSLVSCRRLPTSVLRIAWNCTSQRAGATA